MAPTVIAWRPARKSASSGSKRARSRPCRWKPRSAENGAKNSTATATTAIAETPAPSGRAYVGRFAPSPTGDLHLGSLYTAVASFLDARVHGGRWLLRLEDLDGPREVKGAADRILHTLERFGLEWHGECVRQSSRASAYADALASLDARALTFACTCSRSQLSEETRYPGTCRARRACGPAEASTRVRCDGARIVFEDRIQGVFRQDVEAAAGDFVIRRRDGIVGYVLAVVVDDAAQGITHIVRGADLLDNTPRQIHLQRLLSLPTPLYAHVPVLCEPGGAKLAKSRRSVSLETGASGGRRVRHHLKTVFTLLGLAAPPDLFDAELDAIWRWATQNWSMAQVPKRLAITLQT